MEEVRYILDKCLKNNEPKLIDKIIDTIDDNVDKCKQCGYIDSVDIFNKCNICRRKDRIVRHYKDIFYLVGLPGVVIYDDVGPKLSQYFIDLKNHFAFLDMCEAHDQVVDDSNKIIIVDVNK